MHARRTFTRGRLGKRRLNHEPLESRYLLAAISGIKWHDLNGDGQFNPNQEQTIPDWTIFIDTNNNGEFDDGEPLARTNDTGSYRFVNLEPGTYRVGEVQRPGWEQTFPGGDGLHTVTADDGTVARADFGNRRIAPGSAFGFKWNDLNGDGERQSNEPGLHNWIIYIDGNRNGERDPNELATETNEQGFYSFFGLPPGEYVFAEQQREGWEQTFPGADHDLVHVVQIDSNQTARLDFGNHQLPPPFGSISGVKWNDLNGDGERQNGEPPLANWIIYLDDNRNGIRDDGEPVTETNPNGFYSFRELEPGEYVVAEQNRDGWEQTFPGTDPAGNLGVHVVQLEAGDQVQAHFGNHRPLPVFISGIKWNDLNGDGRRQQGEPGLPDWVIYLDTNRNGQRDDGEPARETNLDGFYHFGELPAGEYVVAEVNREGWIQTFPGSDTGEPGVHVVDLPPGFQVTLNFGNHRPRPGVIFGQKWNDLNGDGQRQNIEPGIEHWQIYIDANQNGQFDDGEPLTETNNDGFYFFDGLEPGRHVIAEIQQEGWVQTFPVTLNGAPGVHDVFVEPGSEIRRDFGNHRLPPPVGTIYGVKWNDLNGDGERQSDEPTMSGWVIFLDNNRNGIRDDGERATETNLDGHYVFAGLEAGEYAVAEVNRDGWQQTFPPADAAGNVGLHIVDVAANQRVEASFGNHRIQIEPGSIHGVKWNDLNADGIRDSNEPGLAQWRIFLDTNNNRRFDSTDPVTVTDDNGHYSFEGIEPGVYHVGEVQRPGWFQTSPPGRVELLETRSDLHDDFALGFEIAGAEIIHTNASGVGAALEIAVTWRDGCGELLVDRTQLQLFGRHIQVATFGLQHSGPCTDQIVTQTQTVEIVPLEQGPYEVTAYLQNVSSQLAVVSATAEARMMVEEHGFHTIAVEPGDVVDGVDFGNHRVPEFGSIHGEKWHDLNADGERQNNEPGLSGVTIYLDLNNNAELDADEPRTRTTEDDTVDPMTGNIIGAGHYWFAQLPEGDYMVREVMPDGFEQTFPREGFHVVDVATGEHVRGVDFGNHRLPPPTGTISGIKWFDINGDGVRQAGEDHLPGWFIYLDDNRNGEFDPDEPNTETNPNGFYSFTDLEPGEYVVAEEMRDGWQQTFPGGANGTAAVHVVHLEAGDRARADFGNRTVPPLNAHIAGVKWHDRNGDGERQSTEPTIAGWVIYLDDNRNGELDPGERATETNLNGFYHFEVEPGEYVVAEGQRENWEQTYPTNRVHVLNLEPGFQAEASFGNRFIRPEGGGIVGTKWHDINGDGHRQPGEPGLADWVIFIDDNENGELDPNERFAVTTEDNPITDFDEGGRYTFADVPPGEHLVREVVMPGWEPTNPVEGVRLVEVHSGRVTDGVDFGNTSLQTEGIAGRHLFYNDSRFDGNDPGANEDDDHAIAVDKRALLPGHRATFANVTSSVDGITGVMVDIIDLPVSDLTADDFEFRVGHRNELDSWVEAPAPEIIAVRPGDGVGDSDRVTLIWPAGEIRGIWLEIRVLANNQTGLVDDDLFYFGSRVGETRPHDNIARVDAIDFLEIRNNPRSFLDPAAINNPFDLNRDGRVNSIDLAIARDHASTLSDDLSMIAPEDNSNIGKRAFAAAKVTKSFGEDQSSAEEPVAMETVLADESFLDDALLLEYGADSGSAGDPDAGSLPDASEPLAEAELDDYFAGLE